jgi:recombination protein RecA
MYNQGISTSGDILDLAVNNNIVEKAGAWFSYGGEKIGQGREAAKTYMQENPEVQAEIAAKVKEASAKE